MSREMEPRRRNASFRAHDASWYTVSDRCTVHSLTNKPFPGGVFKAIEAHTEPKFQSLILTSLPPEVLHIVMDNEDKTVPYKTVPRLFGATCRYLNAIARQYIFKVCPIMLFLSCVFGLILYRSAL